MAGVHVPPRPRARTEPFPGPPRPRRRRGGTRFRSANPRRRATVTLLAFCFVLTLFGGRLIELQALRSDELASAGLDQRMRTSVIPAERGTIADAQGRPLAQTVEVRDITADQTLVVDPAATAAVLARILDVDKAELQKKLTGEQRFVYLAKGVEPAKWRAIQDWRSDPEHNPVTLQAIFSERLTKRAYPNGPLAANLLGFTNAEGKGAVGLEFGLEPELAGTPGEVRAERGPDGSIIPGSEVSRVDPVPGTGVRLTIDADLQWVAQNAIARKVSESGSDFGMVVALEVGTGRILAMASVPTFDPNNPGASGEDDWRNRPVTNAFEPGSTFKVLTHAAVINEGAATPTTPFVVPPGLPRGPHVFRDHTPHGTLQLTLAGVLAQSSNIGTILAAEKISPETYFTYLEAFGVGQPTGLQYPGETSGILTPLKDWGVLTYPSIAFGQGVALSALQIADIYATLANDGVRVEPKLIDAYARPDGTVQTTSPSATHEVVTAETAHQVVEMMERVVSEDGTAPKAGIPGYRVAGKTGTAERVDPACGCYRGYTASFVGLAPADAPRVVVGVWLDNPRGIHYGGVLGGPVFTEVTKAALAELEVPPSGSPPSDIPTIPTTP
jgi:cell division protein FtsI (penicillin-binding protein 3)